MPWLLCAAVQREVKWEATNPFLLPSPSPLPGEKVAIKKITSVLEHVSDATRILREIKLLRMLKHPGVRKCGVVRRASCVG